MCVSPAKTAEPTEIPFIQTRVGPKHHLLYSYFSPCPQLKGKTTELYGVHADPPTGMDTLEGVSARAQLNAFIGFPRLSVEAW